MRRKSTRLIIILVIVLAILIVLNFVLLYNFRATNDPVDNEFRKYVAYSEEKCALVNFLCVPDREPFFDETGCGCQLKQDDDKPSDEMHFCSDESRNADACIEIYQPVCGWNDPEKIKCIRFPCASTYSNSCFACMNPDVLYWTEGECPSG